MPERTTDDYWWIRMTSDPGWLGKRASKFFTQFFDDDVRLLQYGLEGFGFDLPVHWHARMKAVFHVMSVGTRLPDKFKTQAFQSPADFIA